MIQRGLGMMLRRRTRGRRTLPIVLMLKRRNFGA